MDRIHNPTLALIIFRVFKKKNNSAKFQFILVNPKTTSQNEKLMLQQTINLLLFLFVKSFFYEKLNGRISDNNLDTFQRSNNFVDSCFLFDGSAENCFKRYAKSG